MPEWLLSEQDTTPDAGRSLTTEQQLTATQLDHQLLLEAYADLESLYRDDVGWRQVGQQAGLFTAEGRKKMAAVADLSVTGNALIKRGVALRVAYVWGQGVTVSIRDDGSTGQDVNAVWQAFWDDPTNRKEFSSSEAQTRYERRLATTGEAFWALPTDAATGRVRVRKIPPSQIVDRITDPEDEGTVWFYKRVWTAATVNIRTGERGSQDRVALHPALGFRPGEQPPTWGGDPIRWDAPIRPVTVNTPDEDWRGVGDVLAALPWARMDKEFLEDLAVYMRALTRILGQVTAKNPRMAAAVSDALRSAPAGIPGGPGGSGPGSWAVTDPNTTMNLVSKSGAQIDADSHRPYATMTAAALEVPLTMLLGDPGITGARATAETLDQPTELTFGLRREVHTELFRDIADHVIDAAVLAPRGPLRGTPVRDGDRVTVALPDGDERTVQVDWPSYDSTPLLDLVTAIVDADATNKLPPLEVFKLLAAALGIEDADEMIDGLTDADGNWIGFPAVPVDDQNPPLP